MIVNTYTLLVIFLLLFAASLASYLLSQWTAGRNHGGTVGWLALSLGTTLLLTAAVMVVLSARLPATLRFWGSDGSSARVIQSTQPAVLPASSGLSSDAAVLERRTQAETSMAQATPRVAGSINDMVQVDASGGMFAVVRPMTGRHDTRRESLWGCGNQHTFECERESVGGNGLCHRSSS